MSLVESNPAEALERAADPAEILLIPKAAQRDYVEYVRMGGRHDIAVWWERYKDNYQQVTS